MSKENIFKSICWDITSKCNDQCGFCYRNANNIELNLDANKVILKKLIDFGVDKISFVGGEPLLYKDLFELLKYGQEYSAGKIIFSITTNGILLTDIHNGELCVNKKRIFELVNLVEWITFSLDAPSSMLQFEMGRNKHHFKRVLLLMKYISDFFPKIKIKVNTIISKVNYVYLEDLYRILDGCNITRWKLFRFLPSRGNALLNKNVYWIDEDKFLDVTEKLKKRNNDKIKITINDYDDFDNSYITISSAGMLIVYNNEYEEKVDLVHDSVEEIVKYINLRKHNRNRADFKIQ